MNQIKKYGISDFRGTQNSIGQSYTDNFLTDIRNEYSFDYKRRLLKSIVNTYPLNKIFDAQIRLTDVYAKGLNNYLQEIVNEKERVKNLMDNYSIPYSLLCNCFSKFRIEGHEISTHYLSLLEQHDNIAKHIQFSEASSAFEIGGGFGTNIHLLLENYKNIRKLSILIYHPIFMLELNILNRFLEMQFLITKTYRIWIQLNFHRMIKLKYYVFLHGKLKN